MTVDDPVVAQITLGILLRDLREQAEITALEAARHVGLSSASMSKVENGKQGITPENVATLVELYGADDTASAEALKLASVPKSRMRRRRGSSYRDAVPNWFRRLLVVESEATAIEIFENELVPGRLQVENYARVLIQAGAPHAGIKEIDKQVELRMSRQRVLTRTDPPPPRLDVILHEAALHRVVGDDQIMASQLAHLIELSELPTIDLHVQPFRPSPTPNHDEAFTTRTAFTLLKLPERGTVLYVEDFDAATYPEDVQVIQRYAAAFQRLKAATLDPAASRKLIARIARQFQ